MPGHTLRYQVPEDQAALLAWDFGFPLLPAPTLLQVVPAPPPTLMSLLKRDEADVWFKNALHWRNARVCRDLKEFADALRRFFFLAFHLNNNQGRLSWYRFKAARDALTAHPGLDVLELHAFHTMVARDATRQEVSESRYSLWTGELNDRLCQMYKWKHAVINTNRLVMTVLEYAFKTVHFYDYDCRFRGNGKIEVGPFPKLETVAFNNEFHFTGVMKNLLACMTSVKQVKLLGGLDMTIADARYLNEPAPDVGSLTGVSAALPASLVILDLSNIFVAKVYERMLFVTAFAHAAEQGRFNNLEEVIMINTFANMRKSEGEAFLKAFQHCKKLRRVVIGSKKRLKEWHRYAVHKLIDSRGRAFRVEYD